MYFTYIFRAIRSFIQLYADLSGCCFHDVFNPHRRWRVMAHCGSVRWRALVLVTYNFVVNPTLYGLNISCLQIQPISNGIGKLWSLLKMEKKITQWVIIYTLMIGIVNMLRRSDQVGSYTFLSGQKWVKIKFKSADLARRFLIPQNYRQVILYSTYLRFWVPLNWK